VLVANTKWEENINIAYDSKGIDDYAWHHVKDFHIPNHIIWMEHVNAQMEWKGNPASACKMVIMRGPIEIHEIEAFRGPTGHYTENLGLIHSTHPGFVKHLKGGDRIAVYFMVGMGEHKLKVRNLHIKLTGWYHHNKPLVIVEPMMRPPVVVVAPIMRPPVVVVAPIRRPPVVIVEPRRAPMVVVAPVHRGPNVVVAGGGHRGPNVVVAGGGHHGGHHGGGMGGGHHGGGGGGHHEGRHRR